jgi:hypothetical protein
MNKKTSYEFYVYVYKDIDGTPVYVGKGKGNRAYQHLTESSNDRLNKLIINRSKIGTIMEPEIVASGTENNMLMVEVALIKLFGRADTSQGPLFNHTDGGDGVSNPSDEIRSKMSIAAFERHGGERIFSFEHYTTGGTFSGNCPQFAKHIGKDVKAVNRFVSTTSPDVKSIDGWILQGSRTIPNEYNTQFDFVHIGTREMVTCTQAQLVKYTGLSSSLINMMIKGRTGHANGWILKGKEHIVQGLIQNDKGRWYTPPNYWRLKGISETALFTWSIAKELKQAWLSLKAIDPTIRARKLINSLQLSDKVSERVVSSILDKLASGRFDPDSNEDWITFREEYISTHHFPEIVIPVAIYDGRKKQYIYSAEELNKIPDPTADHKKQVTIARYTHSSHQEAAEKYAIPVATLSSRLRKGWTPEQAVELEEPPEKQENYNAQEIDVEGVTFPSLSKAAKAYGLTSQKVHKRLTKFGWNTDQAFGIKPPPQKPGNSAQPVVVKGVSYNSIGTACKAHDVLVSTVNRRRRSGMSLEEALCTPPRRTK